MHFQKQTVPLLTQDRHMWPASYLEVLHALFVSMMRGMPTQHKQHEVRQPRNLDEVFMTATAVPGLQK